LCFSHGLDVSALVKEQQTTYITLRITILEYHEMAVTSDESAVKLTAEYTSPDGQHTFTYSVPTSTKSETTPQTTTDFLSDLRKSAVKMQKDVNQFLTQKMEEDKAASASDGAAGNGSKVDEDKEEDFYGEEVEDED
jgi:hypothetical protein